MTDVASFGSWSNESAAQAFSDIAELLELKGENPFKIKAYIKASRVLRELEEDLEELRAEGNLRKIPGVGKAIADKLEVFLQTGSIPQLEILREETPEGLVDVSRLPGLGSKKTAQLHKELAVDSLESLHQALVAEKVETLKGFSKKTQAKILAAVEKALSRETLFVRSRLEEWAQQTLERFAEVSGVVRAEVVGELRRCCPVAAKLELLFHCEDPAAARRDMEARLGQEFTEPLVGEQSLQFSHPSGCPVLVHFGTLTSGGWNSLRRTGPDSFLESLREKVSSVSLEEVEAESAEQYLQSLGLPFVSPEFRHHASCWELEVGSLLQEKAVRGNLHAHSTYSDGQHTIRDMVREARQRGHQFFGVTDHSRSLVIARGLTPERLREQALEIREIREEFPDFHLWASSEVDILEDGGLDYNDEVLGELDYVVAAVHSFFHLSSEKMTERLLKAVSHPKVRVLAHPTGRLLTRRDGYQADWEAVFRSCAEFGVAVELNASPWRLDVGEELLQLALQCGCLIAVNTDAHSVEEFASLRFGVEAARRALVPAERVVNTWEPERLREWLTNSAS